MDHCYASNQNAGDDKENISPVSSSPALLNYRYQALKVLGEGTFGQVSKCLDHSNGQFVAIKRIKGKDSLFWGEWEACILKELMNADPKRHNFILFKDYFSVDLETFLVFEYFEKNLLEYGNAVIFPLCDMRAIAMQLIMALYGLEKLHIIHSDIKPENIVVVGREEAALQIKLIDFGSAMHSHGRKTVKTDVTTIYYRAPEVLVGLPSDECIDMWSVGCVLAEMFMGEKLYPARDEAELLQSIFASHENIFPMKFKEGTDFGLYLRSSEQGFEFQRSRHNVCPVANLDGLEKLNEPEHLESDDLVAEKLDRAYFVSFLKEILVLDPDSRLTPEQAFACKFLDCTHLLEYRNSPHVMTSLEVICSMAWMS